MRVASGFVMDDAAGGAPLSPRAGMAGGPRKRYSTTTSSHSIPQTPQQLPETRRYIRRRKRLGQSWWGLRPERCLLLTIGGLVVSGFLLGLYVMREETQERHQLQEHPHPHAHHEGTVTTHHKPQVVVHASPPHHQQHSSHQDGSHHHQQQHQKQQQQGGRSLRVPDKTEQQYYTFQILLGRFVHSSSIIRLPTEASKLQALNHDHELAKDQESEDEEDSHYWNASTRDFGDLKIVIANKVEELPQRQVEFESFAEQLNDESEEWEEEHEWDWMDSVDEDYQAYYALDDDYLRGRRVAVSGINPSEEEPTTCRRVAEHRLSFPNCNLFMELAYADRGDVAESQFSYLNHGTFREVFSLQHNYSSATEKVVLKEIRYKDSDSDTEYYEYVRMDALVAERFQNNPRTFDIYGYCGLSLLSEFFLHGDMEEWAMADSEELAEEDFEADQLLTPPQKLILALEMALGLQVLHQNPSMLLHGDVQMSQFLLNSDKTMLKLNDFNRAEFRLFDSAKGEYCQHRNGPGHGNWRAPEEYRNDALSEKVDVFSLGNNFYALLTGVEPILDVKKSVRKISQLQELLVQGKTGHIDPKYLQTSEAERVLATLIPKCWAYEPSQRPSMAEIVQELERAVQKLEQEQQTTRQAILQSLVDE